MGIFIVFKLESHKKVWKNKRFCSFVMPSKDTKILEFNQYQKCDKIPSIIYADIKSLIKRIVVYKNNSQKSSTTIVAERHDVYRVMYTELNFYKTLGKLAMQIINFEKKEKILLTSEQQDSYENTKICCICKRRFKHVIKCIIQLKSVVIKLVNISVLDIAYVI